MKKTIAILFSILFLLCFTGCRNSEKATDSEISNNESYTEKENDPKDGEGQSIGRFKKGLWKVVDKETVTGYYYFSENGTECKYRDAEGRGGVPFDYETKEDHYIFHMGSADNNSKVTLKEESSGTETVFLVWEDGREEELVYIDDITYEEFIKE